MNGVDRRIDRRKPQPLVAFEWFGRLEDKPNIDAFVGWVLLKCPGDAFVIEHGIQDQAQDVYGFLNWDGSEPFCYPPETPWTLGVAVYHESFPVLSAEASLHKSPTNSKKVDWPPGEVQ